MAYVDGFEHDIFISYAHVDDETASGKEGWVTSFVKYLQVFLDKRVGHKNLVKIWRDDRRRIVGNQVFDQVIADAVKASAVFVALTSNGYLASGYCQDELALFYKKASDDGIGLVVDNRQRIFYLLLYNIPSNEWPEAFSGMSGFEFFTAEEDELGVPLEPEINPFALQCVMLADALYVLLKNMKELGLSAEKPAATDEESERMAKDPMDTDKEIIIFMADVSDSLRAYRSRLIEVLQGHDKIKITSDVPPPWLWEDNERAVRYALQDVDLSVHLLDGFAGRRIDGAEGITYPQRQVELALDHAPSQLILVPQELEVETIQDEAHQDFMRALEKEMQGQQAYHFISSSTLRIEKTILETIEEFRPGPDKFKKGMEVFISYARADKQVMNRIKKSLETSGLATWIDEHLKPGTPSWRRAIQEAIERVDCMVVILSPNAKASKWVEAELDYAETQEKPIYPILASGNRRNAVPFGLTVSQWVDIRKNYDDEIKKLLSTIVLA